MTAAHMESVGFSHPTQREWVRERRSRVIAEFITTTALALSLVVAVIAVSIGIARADALDRVTHGAPTQMSCVK